MFNLKEFLAMSEEELWLWLIRNEVTDGAILQCKGGGEKPCPSPETLADLAFRLRDEAVVEYEDNWGEAAWLVYEYVTGAKDKLLTASWFLCTAQPIHFIAAALAAKENE